MTSCHNGFQRVCSSCGILTFIAIILDVTYCQVIVQDGLDSEKYEAKYLYTVPLSTDPTVIQIVADPRFNTGNDPMYELVYMSENPKSEIRRISEITYKINEPKKWSKDIVADYTTIANPNKMGILPEKTVGNQPSYVWWVASGLQETETNSSGGIFLIDLSKNKWMPIPILNKAGKGFTHIEWVDMDIDGYADIVTIEKSNNISSLMWLKQPVGQTQWIRHRVSEIQEDVGGTEFRMMKLPSSVTGTVLNVFIVAGRATGKLTAYWVEDANNDWSRETKIKSMIIGTDGSYNGIEIVDLNMDGRFDILTSISANQKQKGMVLAYEYPIDGFDKGGKWQKHVLSQWPMTSTSYKTISPGPAFSFKIQSSLEGRTQSKPHILVSGQDDGKVHILTPLSQSPYIWDCQKQVIFSSGERVGIPAIADVDGDGEVEIFIPSNFSINVLRYSAQKVPPSRTGIPTVMRKFGVFGPIINAVYSIVGLA